MAKNKIKRCINRNCRSQHVDKTGPNEWTCYECLSKWGKGKKRTQPKIENCDIKKGDHLPLMLPPLSISSKSLELDLSQTIDKEYFTNEGLQNKFKSK